MGDDFNAKLTPEAARENATRERSRSLLASIAFAMAKDDFEEKECLAYMDLAFEASDAHSYGACATWLSKRGLVSKDDAKALLKKALFCQRPSAMAVLGESFPFLGCGAGLDADWRAGLAMAMLSGDERSTLAISRIVLGLESGEKLLASAVDEARGLVSSPPEALWLDEEDKARLAKFNLMESICEKALIEACALPGLRSGAQAPTL